MGLLDRLQASVQGDGGPSVTTTTTATAPSTATVTSQPKLRLKKDNAFPWRRFVISVVGIFMILFVWRWSIFHLYTLPPTSIAVYGSITISTLYAITFIVAFFITGQAYFTNWSNASVSNIASEVKSYFESKKSVDKKVTKDKK